MLLDTSETTSDLVKPDGSGWVIPPSSQVRSVSQGYIRIKCRKTVFIIEINIFSCCDMRSSSHTERDRDWTDVQDFFFILISRFVAYITLDNSDYFSSFGVRLGRSKRVGVYIFLQFHATAQPSNQFWNRI